MINTKKIYRNIVKRSFDVLFSVVILVLISPFLLIIGLTILTFMGRPILFRQYRPGKNENKFLLLKFRTMNDEIDSYNIPLEDRFRITILGKFLRKTSLDELPELFNVLKGDMSLVGPRPLLIRYLPFYSIEERKRALVRPGITGLAQISGRNNLSWDQRLKLDVEYVDLYSFFFDLKILFLTFFYVVIHRDVNVDPAMTMKDLDEERKLE